MDLKKLDKENSEIRYIRCLLVKHNGHLYLIDGDINIIRKFSYDEFNIEEPIYIPFNGVNKDRKYGGK